MNLTFTLKKWPYRKEIVKYESSIDYQSKIIANVKVLCRQTDRQTETQKKKNRQTDRQDTKTRKHTPTPPPPPSTDIKEENAGHLHFFLFV